MINISHAPNINWSKIPVIDLSSSSSSNEEKEDEGDIDAKASAILSAASTYGFLYIKPSEDELPANLLAQMFDLVI